jgi:glutamine synthetase
LVQSGNSRAPLTISYGVEDRDSAIRIIKSPSRIEVRVPGADVNPYLAFAAIIACGHHGLLNKMKPVVGEKIPRSLEKAVEYMMAEGSLAREVLGNAFVEHFGKTRLSECRLYGVAVTDWEVS